MISMNGNVVRVYLPPDANCLLWTADHCLRSRDYVNLVVIDKQPELQYLDIDAAREHCARGAGEWAWAGNSAGHEEPTSCWPASATSRRRRRSPPPRCCASMSPSCASASSTSST